MEKPLPASPQAELAAYARDALAILRQSIRLAQQGQPFFYRVAALQLRLLLCDSTRRHERIVDVSLLPRIFPQIRFHPLGSDGRFDRAAPPLALAVWLEQPLPPAGAVTIRQLIRRVCDQDGGAHVDPKAHTRPDLLPNTPDWILRIAACILDELEGRL